MPGMHKSGGLVAHGMHARADQGSGLCYITGVCHCICRCSGSGMWVRKAQTRLRTLSTLPLARTSLLHAKAWKLWHPTKAAQASFKRCTAAAKASGWVWSWLPYASLSASNSFPTSQPCLPAGERGVQVWLSRLRQRSMPFDC